MNSTRQNFLLIFLSVCIFIIDVKAIYYSEIPARKLRCRLGKSQYEIHLIDLRRRVCKLFTLNGVFERDRQRFADGVFSGIDDGALRMFSLNVGWHKKHGNVYRIGIADVTQLLDMDVDDVIDVKAYDDGRILPTFACMNEINESRDRALNVVDVFPKKCRAFDGYVTSVDGYQVPMIGTHKRANLFDMFSRDVDRYLLDYGISEIIVHRNKANPDEPQQDHHQISLFGILKGIDEAGNNFRYFGFFQYTFNQDGVCYHRAFKPWTVSHLRSVSNSPTQSVLRLAALLFLIEEIERTESESLTDLQSVLLQACFAAKDHSNWWYVDPYVTKTCKRLLETIRCCNTHTHTHTPHTHPEPNIDCSRVSCD